MLKKRHRILPILLSILLLAGCQGAPPPTPSPTPEPTPTPTPSPTPTPQEEFVLPCYADESFHPITGGNKTNLTLAPLVYEGLFELDGAFAAQNVLCASYTVSEDGLTWTFTVRPGVTFSDGSPLTASDAAYSLRLAMGEGSPYAGRLSGIAAVKALDETTLTVALSAPNGALPALLDIPVVKGEGGRPLGTGPFVLTGEGDALSLEARPGWWRNKSMPVSHIELYAVREADDLIHGFDTSAISLVTADLTGSNALGYSGSYEVWDYPTSILLYVGYNAEKGPCKDSAVRRALSYAYERTAVTKSLLSGHAQSAGVPAPPGSALYDAALAAAADYDPQTVEALLDEAGWAIQEGVRVKGRKSLALTLLVNAENSYKSAIADHLAAALTRAGAVVEVRKAGWTDYLAALEQGDFDLYIGEVKLTADLDLAALIAPEGALNYGGYENEETAALAEAFRAAQGDARKAAASALYRQLAQEAPFTALCFKNWSVLTHWGRLGGLAPTQQNVFYGFSEWKAAG